MLHIKCIFNLASTKTRNIFPYSDFFTGLYIFPQCSMLQCCSISNAFLTMTKTISPPKCFTCQIYVQLFFSGDMFCFTLSSDSIKKSSYLTFSPAYNSFQAILDQPSIDQELRKVNLPLVCYFVRLSDFLQVVNIFHFANILVMFLDVAVGHLIHQQQYRC